jgi:hypothetical protein
MPRNRPRFERGRVNRAEIHAALLAQPSDAKPLTAKRIQPLLSRHLEERTIQWHMQAIRSAQKPDKCRS